MVGRVIEATIVDGSWSRPGVFHAGRSSDILACHPERRNRTKELKARPRRWLAILVAAVAAAGLPVATPAPAALPAGELLFSSARRGNFEVFRSAPDGTGQVNLTNKRLAEDLDPAWAPQGNRIVFARNGARQRYPDLWVMKADGSGQTRLTSGPAADRHPAWSPDGEWIAFVRSFPPQGTSQILIVSPDGSRLRKLTDTGPGVLNASPSWSPDGLRIAFASNRDGGFPEIYTMTREGAGLRRLTVDDRIDASPAWSPDGTSIAFERYGGGDADLWVMDADGIGQRNVTKSPADESDPSWSPDGSHLAFAAAPQGGGDRDVFVIPVDGGARSRVTTAGRADLSPSWAGGVGSPGAAAASTASTVGLPQIVPRQGERGDRTEKEVRKKKKRKRRVVRRVAPGVKLIKVRRRGPRKIFALRVDPTRRPSIDVALGRGVLPGLQRTRRIARRNRALAAVNGDFALPGGRPSGPFAADGDLKQSSFRGGTVFGAAGGGRSARIADPKVSMTSVEGASGDVWPVHRWNDGPPVYGEVAGFSAAGSSLELPPRASCAARLVPDGRPRWADSERAVERDYVVDRTGCFSARLRRGKSVVLAAHPGSPEALLLRSLEVGEQVTLGWSLGFPRVLDGIGGFPLLVRKGRLIASACGDPLCSRHPRTGIGITRNGHILLVVVDGRQPNWSVGMTLVEFAREMRRQGAVEAMNLDGGGSSTMVLRGRILNRPSDGKERAVSSAVLVLRRRDRGERLEAPTRSARAPATFDPTGPNPAFLDAGSTGGMLDALARGSLGPRVRLPEGLQRLVRAFRLVR